MQRLNPISEFALETEQALYVDQYYAGELAPKIQREQRDGSRVSPERRRKLPHRRCIDDRGTAAGLQSAAGSRIDPREHGNPERSGLPPGNRE